MPTLSFIVSMSMYMLLLYMFLDFTREKESFYKWFFIVALFSLPLWFVNLHSWFRWAKTISVLIPICFLSFVRIANNGQSNKYAFLKKKWPMMVLYAILMLNIVEASLQDFQLGNLFNALCGAILIVTIPLPKKHWRIGQNDGKNSFAEIIADLPLAWCLLYVSWNAAFVYAENTSYFASSVCILVVPEIWIFVKKRVDLWLMARIYTLGIHILIRSSYDIFTAIMDSSAWFSSQVMTTWGMANFALHAAYLVYWFFNYRNKAYVIKYSEQATLLDLQKSA